MKKILHCADMQGGFMDSDLKELYVDGARDIINDINIFLMTSANGVFERTIFTYDTHFWFEYNSNPEANLFPSIHCEYGTRAWDLSVLSHFLNAKTTWHVCKNEFDFWGQNKLTDKIQILDTRLNEYPMNVSFEEMGKKIELDLNDIQPIAEILPATAKKELKKYLGDKGNIVIVPLHSTARTEGVLVFEKDGQKTALAFVRENLVQAYKDLFHSHQQFGDKSKIHRDEFLKDIGADTEVVIAGVASDYCVKQAMIGYLQRGCQVVVLSDLVKGIGQQIDEVVQSPELKSYYESEQLQVTDSVSYLKAQFKQKPDIRPKPLL